jgi:hypothetical protein
VSFQACEFSHVAIQHVSILHVSIQGLYFRLWAKVTRAIDAQDQVAATEQKTVLEQAQRESARALMERGGMHTPRLFQYDAATECYTYKHAEWVVIGSRRLTVPLL